MRVRLPERREIRPFPWAFVPPPLRHCVSTVGGAGGGAGFEHLRPYGRITLPCAPCSREIAKRDVTFQVYGLLGAFRIYAHRYETMPQWCCYRGSEHVFLMADNLIVTPLD